MIDAKTSTKRAEKLNDNRMTHLYDTEAEKYLRPIDKHRLDTLYQNSVVVPEKTDIWYIHSVLAQCFLPYRDPKTRDWDRRNGNFSISLTAGRTQNPKTGEFEVVGLPFGAKPRLFQSYVCTQALKQRSCVVSIERSMTAMIKELGFHPRGGQRGTINSFKDQITRFALCHFQLIAPGSKENHQRYVNAQPIKSFDVWFPPHPEQGALWASEIELTKEFYENLTEHAVPYDFRGMKVIQNNARAQDIYLWMTQRLCRLSAKKPLFMTWQMLYEMFGGNITHLKMFKTEFKKALLAAYTAYPNARVEEDDKGYRFYMSPPPIPKTRAMIQNPVNKPVD